MIPKTVPMKGRTAPKMARVTEAFLPCWKAMMALLGENRPKVIRHMTLMVAPMLPARPRHQEVFVVVEVPALVQEVGEQDTGQAQRQDGSEHAVEVGALRSPVNDVVQVFLDAGAFAVEELQRIGTLALGPLTCLGLVVARPLMIKAGHAVGDHHEDGFHDGPVVLFLEDLARLDVHSGHPDQQVDEGNLVGPGRLELHVQFIVGGHDHCGID
jgi:hypothetical protein